MRAAPTCPRCFGPLHEPSVWSSAWRCDTHGDVLPLQPSRSPTRLALDALRQISLVPVWLAWPLPPGWLVSGFTHAGDERTGVRASVVALTGPSITHGPADLLLIAEEPGVGLGAAYAGIPGPDPGAGFAAQTPHAKVETRGHPTALWCVDGVPEDRAVYVGEALGRWLWMVAWPAEVGAFIALAELAFTDLREHDFEVPFGAFSPRLE